MGVPRTHGKGTEALLRWRAQRGSLVSRNLFFPQWKLVPPFPFGKKPSVGCSSSNTEYLTEALVGEPSGGKAFLKILLLSFCVGGFSISLYSISWPRPEFLSLSPSCYFLNRPNLCCQCLCLVTYISILNTLFVYYTPMDLLK